MGSFKKNPTIQKYKENVSSVTLQKTSKYAQYGSKEIIMNAWH